MSETVIIVLCFAGVVVAISLVLIAFLWMAKRLEQKYVENLKGELLLAAMDKDTIFERMVKGGRVLQYVTILGAFAAIFFLAVLGKVSPEIAGTIIGMIITGVIGAEAGSRMPGELRRELQLLKEKGEST